MTSPDRDALTDQLIDAGAEIVRRGLVLASGGNLSVRRPGSDSFIVTASLSVRLCESTLTLTFLPSVSELMFMRCASAGTPPL